MKIGDEVELRMFGDKPSMARVRHVFPDGDLLLERLGDGLPEWVPRLGRFEARYVRPAAPKVDE